MECRVTLGRADNKDNADSARLNITFSCDNHECQTLKQLEAQKNSHLVEFRTEDVNSCSPCKRQFKCADDLMDHIKWYHKTCAECVKHGVTYSMCRREKIIMQQLSHKATLSESAWDNGNSGKEDQDVGQQMDKQKHC